MNTNWEEYRKTAAMAAMQALLQNANYVSDKTKSCYTVTEWADDTLLDKVCDWIDEHFINRVKWEIATYEFESIESMKEELRKAMKD